MHEEVINNYAYDDALKKFLDEEDKEEVVVEAVKEEKKEEGGEKKEEIMNGEAIEIKKEGDTVKIEEGERKNDEGEGMEVDTEIDELIRMKKKEFEEKEEIEQANQKIETTQPQINLNDQFQAEQQQQQQQQQHILHQEQQQELQPQQEQEQQQSENINQNVAEILKDEIYNSPKRKLEEIEEMVETPLEAPLSPKRRKIENENEETIAHPIEEIEVLMDTKEMNDETNEKDNTEMDVIEDQSIQSVLKVEEIVDGDQKEKKGSEEKHHPLYPHFNDHLSWKRQMQKVPTLEFIKQLDELTNASLISLSLLWLRENNEIITQHDAKWFYFFFARLAEPLLRNTASDLRELVLIFSTQRSTLTDPNDPMKDELNGLIVIINKIFGQMI
jgi:hypothetical protein